VVHDQTGGSADDVVITDLAIPTFNGEPAAGNWTVLVQDLAGLDVGTLDSWSVTVTGDCGPGGGGWSGAAEPDLALVDNGSACSTVTVADDGDASVVLLDVDGVHDWRSVLRGTLEHNGVVADAFPGRTFPSEAGSFNFTNRAVAGFSGSAAGDWTLCIIDTDAFGDSGTLLSWSVHE
jgi:subtilisin-like proprotein convertase family protein